MKKYLLMGLTILLGTNLAVLAGVAYNRTDDATAQLTLTERELNLPYSGSFNDENSGMSLSLVWRTPTQDDDVYQSYNSNGVDITKEQLLALGFVETTDRRYDWLDSQELFWAFEFDGVLHKAEIEKTERLHEKAIAAYKEQPNEENNRKKDETNLQQEREKKLSSRLFFVEASADYEPLASKFADQKNILIVKGLTRYYYSAERNSYHLMLNELSVRHIMVPLKFSETLSRLVNENPQDRDAIRFTADIKWGKRLEPWIVDVKEKAAD